MRELRSEFLSENGQWTEKQVRKYADLLLKDIRFEIRDELARTRAGLEDVLGSAAMGLLPVVMPEGSDIVYRLRIEGADSTRPEQRNEEYFQQGVYSPSELSGDWRNHLVLDDDLKEHRHDYLPEGSDHLLSSMHDFAPLVRDKKGSINLNGRRYGPDDRNKMQWRIKSGIESLWDLTDYLTGIRETHDLPGAGISSTAGIRIVAEPERFGGVFLEAYERLKKDRFDSENFGLLRFHMVKRDGKFPEDGYSFRQFTKLLPHSAWNRFSDRRLLFEKSDIDVNRKVDNPFYVELFTHVGEDSKDVFHNNVISTLIYPSDCFNAMDAHEIHSRTAYKARKDNERWQDYGPIEWRVAQRLAPAILDAPSAGYARDVIKRER